MRSPRQRPKPYLTMSMTTCTLSPAVLTVVDRGVAGRERRVVMQHVAVLDQVVVVIVRVPPVCHTSVDAVAVVQRQLNCLVEREPHSWPLFLLVVHLLRSRTCEAQVSVAARGEAQRAAALIHRRHVGERQPEG